MKCLEEFDEEVDLFLDSRLYSKSPYDHPENFGCIDALYSRNDLSLGQKSAIVGGSEVRHKLSKCKEMLKKVGEENEENLLDFVHNILPYIDELQRQYGLMGEAFEAYQP